MEVLQTFMKEYYGDEKEAMSAMNLTNQPPITPAQNRTAILAYVKGRFRPIKEYKHFKFGQLAGKYWVKTFDSEKWHTVDRIKIIERKED